MWHIHDSGDWFLMALVMAVFWVPLALLGFWFIGQLGPRSRTQPPAEPPAVPPAGPDAREEARLAYARGELSRERFLEVMDDLDRTERNREAKR